MKKRMLFCALFVMMLVTNIYADPIAGKWTAMKDPCFMEFTIKNDKTVDLWAACWDTDANCFVIGDLYGTWQKNETGIYFMNVGGLSEVLIIKGTVATTFNNLTLLKGVPLKKTKDMLYSNQCF